jgi:hypothetical protein
MVASIARAINVRVTVGLNAKHSKHLCLLTSVDSH